MLDSWWFASCWDEGSVDFMEQFDPPCYKIASASLTDDALLRHHRKYGRPIILSTGMSDLDEIDHAVEVLGTDDLVLMHATSTYPSQPEELNLRAIVTLQERYGVPVGYSGHEVGLAASVAAVALGACMIERHITLDRAMWGSDQAASVEPAGFARLVKDVRAVETALGDGVKVVYDSEIPIKEKLRRVDTRRAASA
jgi:N-acetylneuraminate synthase